MLLAMCVALLALPAAASAQAPVNDNYLDSKPLNVPGSRLNRTDSLVDRQNTSQASVQADVFNPPGSGAPAEPTMCSGASYGKTIWYDFYPDITGRVGIRTSGFDSVIRVVPFNGKTGAPNFPASQCVNDSSGTTEAFELYVLKGRSYTVQIGGVNGAGGTLESEFQFAADPDVDGVLGREDDCPRLKGPARRDGCPLRLSIDTTLRALPTANGIELDGVRVSNNRTARVQLRCRACGKQVRRGRSVSFPGLRGHQLPAGGKLEIRVTRRGAIGAYIAYTIQRGNFKKGPERCMNPGSRKPRRKCG
jgi:hypothetical protein